MKIIRNKTTKLVHYIFPDGDDVVIEAVMIKPFKALDIKADTHEILEGVESPSLFVGAAMAYNGVWSIVNQEAYNMALEQEKLKLCEKVDEKTKASILELASENKQRNYLAKYNELLEKKFDGTITADEATQMTDLKALWTQIETLVIDGNAKEVEIMNCNTIEELEAIVI